MKIQRISPNQYQRQPWKNGGGVTTELAREDVDGKMLWRISIASVAQSGPFSDFTGFDRTIMLLAGEGMVLSYQSDEGTAVRRDHRSHSPH